jgi:hypothetical protein
VWIIRNDVEANRPRRSISPRRTRGPEQLLLTRYYGGHTRNVMNEVLTKSFWQGVKKTFYDALEGPPPEDKALQAADPSKPKDPSTSETPAPPAPSPTTEQH